MLRQSLSRLASEHDFQAGRPFPLDPYLDFNHPAEFPDNPEPDVSVSTDQGRTYRMILAVISLLVILSMIVSLLAPLLIRIFISPSVPGEDLHASLWVVLLL
jgi:hypothetical protein